MSTTKKAIRVLIVDDHPVVRQGLHAMLADELGIAVVGEAESGEEAIKRVGELEPDVVLTDIRMPGMGGIEATERIKGARPSAAVVVLTMYDTEMHVVKALRAGAAGYLVKDCSRELLCHTIREVIGGGTLVRSGLLRQAIQGLLHGGRFAEGDPASAGVKEPLTPRELDALGLVAQGYANRRIALELNVAESTAKKYVQSIIAKLGASDRTHAAIMAVRMGLVE